jgi:hypothetical protein
MTFKYITIALSRDYSTSFRHIWQDNYSKKYFISSDERTIVHFDNQSFYIELKEKLNKKHTKQLTEREINNKIVNHDGTQWTFIL